MLVRICGSCGRKVPQGQPCPCQRQRYKTYNKEHRDRGRAAFYDSHEWRATAEAARARAGYADEYARAYDGRLAPGKIVHHIHREYAASPDRKAAMIALLEAIRASGQD